MKPQNRLLLAASIFVAAAPAVHAVDVIKANNTNALNLGTSWSGGAAPGTGDVAVWDGTVAAANTTDLGTDLSWAGLKIANPGGAVEIRHAANQTLTLGASGIDMSSATQNLTLLSAITANTAGTLAIGSNQTWNVASGRTLTLFSMSNSANQRLSGSGNINVNGGGTIFMNVGDLGSTSFTAGNGNDTFTGNWNISGGSKVVSLRNGTHGWGRGSITLDNGTMSQHQGNWSFSNNITVASGGGTIYSDSSGNNRYMNLTGVISGSGNLAFNAVAAMTGNEGFILTGINTFTGGMTINPYATVRIGGDATTTSNSASAGNLGSIAASVVVTNNGILGFGRTDEHTFSNNISGSGIVRLGRVGGVLPSSQVVTLSGTNTYTGGTQVNAGRLHLTGSLTSATSVSAGARISGTGSTTGLLTMNAGSSIGLLGGGTTTSLTSNGVNFAGATSLAFLTAPVASTVYDVVTYGAGGVTNLANFNPGVRGTVNNDTVAQKITFTAGGAEARTWNTTSGTWDVGATGNWVEGDQKFFPGDSVVFGDIASDATVTLSGALAPNGVTVQNSANTYTFTGSAITGSTSLTKSNAGTLTISSQQTYTGGTTVNGGTLRLTTSTGGTGTIRGTLNINSGATVEIGGTDVLGYSTGSDAVRTINMNGGTLVQTQNRNETNTAVINMAGGSTIAATGGANALFDMFGGTAAINSSGDVTNNISSPIRFRQNGSIFNVADGAQDVDLLVSGVVSRGVAGEGDGALIKNGAGTMRLTASNTFSGNLTINGGVLELSSTGKLYNGGFNSSAVITVNNGGTWRMPDYSYGGVGQLADYAQRRVLNGGTIEVTGNSHASGQDFTVTAQGGTFRYSATGQTLTLTGNGNTNTQLDGTLTFDTTGNIEVSGVSAILQGTGGLTKTGAGTLTLGADNTYTGNTHVTQGTLVINGSVSTGNLTIGSGATLMGSGTVGGATSIAAGAYLSPGNSPEIMTFENSLGLNGTTILEIGGLIRGTDYDGVDVAGLLSYGGALSIVSWNSFSLATAASYQLFGISGGSTGSFDSVSVGGLSLVNDGGGIWSAADPGDSEIVYTFTQSSGQLVVIPEPGAALLGGLGLVLLLRRRR